MDLTMFDSSPKEPHAATSRTAPCPGCGGPLHDEASEEIWILLNKFYCSEECCRRAAARI